MIRGVEEKMNNPLMDTEECHYSPAGWENQKSGGEEGSYEGSVEAAARRLCHGEWRGCGGCACPGRW